MHGGTRAWSVRRWRIWNDGRARHLPDTISNLLRRHPRAATGRARAIRVPGWLLHRGWCIRGALIDTVRSTGYMEEDFRGLRACRARGRLSMLIARMPRRWALAAAFVAAACAADVTGPADSALAPLDIAVDDGVIFPVPPPDSDGDGV